MLQQHDKRLMHLTYINSYKLIKNPTDKPEDTNNQFTENKIRVA